VSEVICLGSVNHALDRIEALLEKTYSSNSSVHGWYHRLESEIPGPTATALGLYFFVRRRSEFRHTADALGFLKAKQVKANLAELDGGWPINTSYSMPVVESTAWVARLLGSPGLGLRKECPSSAAAFRWLQLNQNSDGGWGSLKNQPSRVYLTALAIRALAALNPIGDEITREGVRWLLARRDTTSGAWGVTPTSRPTVMHTAAALLAIAEARVPISVSLDQSYDWMLEHLEPSSLWDSLSTTESYNVEAITSGQSVTWHNSLPHYATPFAIQALLVRDPARFPMKGATALKTVLDKQLPSGNWQNVEGGEEPSIWNVWPFAEALFTFQETYGQAQDRKVIWKDSIVVTSSMQSTELQIARAFKETAAHRVGVVALRSWALILLVVFVAVGATLSVMHVIEWKDFGLSLVFPIALFGIQEASKKRRDRPND